MLPITRRAAAAGAASILGAQFAAAQQPPELRGKAEGGKVALPNTRASSEVESSLPNPDPVGKRLGIAVVGIGRLTLEQIMPGFGQSKHARVTALVSGDREKARTVAAQYGLPETHLYDYANFDRLRDNPDVDAVYIVLPNDMHMEYTLRSAQAGKHVLCEKPMATSSADAARMVEGCRAAGRKLMIAYRLQYDPYHRALIEMARKGEHGPVRLITAANTQNQGNPQQWRQFKQPGRRRLAARHRPLLSQRRPLHHRGGAGGGHGATDPAQGRPALPRGGRYLRLHAPLPLWDHSPVQQQLQRLRKPSPPHDGRRWLRRAGPGLCL